MRAIDDKIIYKLNTTIPTVSFAGEVSAQDKCKELHDQVGAFAEVIIILSYIVYPDCLMD